MRKKVNITILRSFLMMVLISGGWVFFQAIVPSTYEDLKAKEHTMSLDNNTVITKATMPTIDTAVPAVYETASFGLG